MDKAHPLHGTTQPRLGEVSVRVRVRKCFDNIHVHQIITKYTFDILQLAQLHSLISIHFLRFSIGWSKNNHELDPVLFPIAL